MRLRRIVLCLPLGLLLLFMAPFRDNAGADRPSYPGQATPVPEDEAQLAKDVKAGDAIAALGFFRKRTPSAAEAARWRTWIRRLGHDSLDVRDRAMYDLLAQGRAAAGLLRQAVDDSDAEIAQRARHCLDALRGEAVPSLLPTAVQLVADKKPVGTTAVLLGWFPFADTEDASDAVLTALAALAVHNGRPDEVLVKGLEDAEPLRRAAAATALLRAQAPDARAAAQRLLLDPDPEVRWRVGLALVAAQERAAVPVLIDLLAELSGERQEQVEELLTRMAGPHAPAAPRGTDADARRRGRDAWMGWWRDHADAVDLANLPEPRRQTGDVVLMQMGLEGMAGECVTVNRDGVASAPLFRSQYPIAVQPLPDGRLLVAQYRPGQVTTRDRSGRILWDYQAAGPVVSAQRLADGTTFIAERNRLLEVDGKGKEVLALTRPRRDVAAAREAVNGHFVVVTLTGVCQHLDRDGQELRQFDVGQVAVGAGIDVLSTRRALIPEYDRNRVAEYDPDGRLAWQASVDKPTAALRLANGHTLIGSTTTRKVVEVDRWGYVVWQYQATEAVTALGRR